VLRFLAQKMAAYPCGVIAPSFNIKHFSLLQHLYQEKFEKKVTGRQGGGCGQIFWQALSGLFPARGDVAAGPLFKRACHCESAKGGRGNLNRPGKGDCLPFGSAQG
jgi:hypothetical protein